MAAKKATKKAGTLELTELRGGGALACGKKNKRTGAAPCKVITKAERAKLVSSVGIPKAARKKAEAALGAKKPAAGSKAKKTKAKKADLTGWAVFLFHRGVENPSHGKASAALRELRTKRDNLFIETPHLEFSVGMFDRKDYGTGVLLKSEKAARGLITKLSGIGLYKAHGGEVRLVLARANPGNFIHGYKAVLTATFKSDGGTLTTETF